MDADHGQRAAADHHRERHRRHGQPVGHPAPQTDRRAARSVRAGPTSCAISSRRT
ncbi:hypothetical protein LP420_17360 [Massilia sp. B-10]|nr:hypothetical protein LP420_17360 [Massilia sp. B-10]